MDTSADLGVSLDELSIEINEDDHLKQVTTAQDSRDRVDVDVFEFGVNSQNTDIYDTLKMDASTDLGVSLDELTVEIDEDDNLKKIAKAGDSRVDIDVLKFGDAVEIDEHDDMSAHLTTDMKKWSPHEKQMVTESTNIEQNTHSSFDFKDSSIITSTKDDSDSEFEVPDRPLAPPDNSSVIPSANVHKELTLNQELADMECVESNQDMNINLTPQNPSQLQQAIWSSHDETSMDPLILSQSSQTIQMETDYSDSLRDQNNRVEFSEANNIENSFNSTFEAGIKNYKKASQDFPPKSEPLLDSQSFMQHQVSDVNKANVKKLRKFKELGNSAFPVNPDTEGGENNAEKYSKPSLVTTADDWDNIQTIEPGFLKSSDRLSGPELVIESKPLTSFSDSWTCFQTADYTSVKDQIKIQVDRRGFSALTHMLFGPPKLHRDLLPQRELVFCVAATPFDNNNEAHNRVLQTIYRCLTGSRFDCQRFGSHWEEIGFQGKDPATDLRGTGMLALLHLLYFLQSPSTKNLAKDVYKLSLHPTQNFPFCVMGINLSRICLQVLREDVYNKECNRRKDVISTVNNIYAALFLQLYGAWKKGKSIMDSGFVLQEVETYSRKHSKSIFKEFEAYEQVRKQHGQSRKDSDAEPSFFNVCKEDKS